MSFPLHKIYWKWDDDYYSTLFRLGDNVQELVDNEVLLLDEDGDTLVNGEWPWSVTAREGQVASIFFRIEFFDLINESIWELPVDRFCELVDKHLERAEDTTKGDFLYAVFRGKYIAIAGLIRKWKAS